jgi:hypothetical protein
MGGQAMAATQFQQLQAEQDAKSTAEAVKAAAAEVQRLKDALAAANAADKQRLRDELAKASIALETAKSNNETAQLNLAAAQAKQTAAATASSNAAATLQNVTPENAVTLVEELVDAAGGIVNSTTSAQVAAANQLLTAQRDEAEKLAKADAADAAARVAADLAIKIALSKSQAELNAAAAAAVADAKKLADDALQNSTVASGLANSKRGEASSLFQQNSGNTELAKYMNEYMDSSPAVDGKIVVTPTPSRSIASIFTPEQLSGANGDKLKQFIAKWDQYTDAEMKKYAALAELDTKNKAYTAVDTLAKDIANLSFDSAKNAANTKLLEIQNAAQLAADAAETAETERLRLAKIEAAAQAAREVAALAKAAAEKLAEDILADVSKATQLAADLKLQLSTEAGEAEGALTGLDTAAAAAKAAADKAIADAEEAARQVPVSQGGTKPIQATDTASNLI